MVETSLVSGFLLYSHMIPAIFGISGILLIASGIMDNKREYTLGGIGLFLAAGILPFLVLPFVLGI